MKYTVNKLPAVATTSTVRSTRTYIYTGTASTFTPGFTAGLTAICQGNSSGTLCPPGSCFFETGWMKGAQTLGSRKHHISWSGAFGSDFDYGITLTDHKWYVFQTLYSNSAARWEGWLYGVPQITVSGLGFTSGNFTNCALESKSLSSSTPAGSSYCYHMRYRVSTNPWTYYDYEPEAPYCVFRPWTYGMGSYGSSSSTCP